MKILINFFIKYLTRYLYRSKKERYKSFYFLPTIENKGEGEQSRKQNISLIIMCAIITYENQRDVIE